MRKYLYKNSAARRYLWLDVEKSRSLGIGVHYDKHCSGYTYREEGYNMSQELSLVLGRYTITIRRTWKDLKRWFKDNPNGLYGEKRDWPSTNHSG